MSGRIGAGNGSACRFEDGDFNTQSRLDIEAREKWFYQAIGASPAMFRRDANAGSLYWLGLRDREGLYLEGAQQLQALGATARSRQAVLVGDGLRRRHTLADSDGAAESGAALAVRAEGRHGVLCRVVLRTDGTCWRREPWIQTLPGRGWFAYFRIYGPESHAFDGSWKPGDFAKVK